MCRLAGRSHSCQALSVLEPRERVGLLASHTMCATSGDIIEAAAESQYTISA